jgi:hypothetical protein
MSSVKYKKFISTQNLKHLIATAQAISKLNFLKHCILKITQFFYVDDIAISHSWRTVEDFSENLYMQVINKTSGTTYPYIIGLTTRNYTGTEIATEIQTKLTAHVIGGPWVVSYNLNTNTLKIITTDGNHQFRILTPTELKTGLSNSFTLSYDRSNPHDCNEILSNLEKVSKICDNLNPYESGYLNMQPIRNLYLHSSALGNYNSIGPDGCQTIIKKIPVTSDYNIMIFDQCVLYNDYNDCSQQTLRTIDFQLKTSRGDIVPLHGVDMSLSIVLSRASTDT